MPDPDTDGAEDRAARLQRVRAFVRRHYGLRGSARLHRHALGLDLLRAPVNVALAPVFLLTRLLAGLLWLVRLRGAARWLAGRRILLGSSVAHAVQTRVRDELIVPMLGPDTPLSARQQACLEDYTAVRSAVAEITTSLIVLAMGFAVFRMATPGVISLAPVLTGRMAEAQAVSSFPLGQTLGGVWYGVFPVELPLWHVIAIGVALALIASVITTFAGLLADPVQAATGTHRRRLMRLLARVERDGAPAMGSEHLLARTADIVDAGGSLIRFLRP
ncbi:DUF6635 family protein [Tranquillimonas rosea]|uniref:DUF6635 family protein n=1 Tax=Tranquillimonas rosea TaxID=641238 RepID=UPI003BAB7930